MEVGVNGGLRGVMFSCRVGHEPLRGVLSVLPVCSETVDSFLVNTVEILVRRAIISFEPSFLVPLSTLQSGPSSCQRSPRGRYALLQDADELVAVELLELGDGVFVDGVNEKESLEALLLELLKEGRTLDGDEGLADEVVDRFLDSGMRVM